ncbi:MAG: transglutaminase-like domain-containing protein [Deltaproteobacteria bacterium]
MESVLEELHLSSEELSDYLKVSEIINYDHKSIQALTNDLAKNCADEIEKIKTVYEYVRDLAAHSADTSADSVSCTASDVLINGHGICYAKAHLLAAMLRYLGIPTGFCYQRLVLDEDNPEKLALHGLNAVYISSLDKWIRMDARGNKQGVNAQFSIDEEILAFKIRPKLGERDIPWIFHEPLPVVVEALRSTTDLKELWRNLPDDDGQYI